MIHVTPDELLGLRRAVDEARDTDGPHVHLLREALDRAVKVWPDRLPPEVVGMRSLVRLRDGTRTRAVSLVLPEDADPDQGLVSALSPLGAALLGRRVGERFVVREPEGEREIDVLGVISRPEVDGGAREFEGLST
jgi:regulator of nucleoside diphosphate kinase